MKCKACNPKPAAASTLRGESSIKTAVEGAIAYRSINTRKIAGSGLAIRSSPETTMPSNQLRNSNRSRAIGNVSPDQFVNA